MTHAKLFQAIQFVAAATDAAASKGQGCCGPARVPYMRVQV